MNSKRIDIKIISVVALLIMALSLFVGPVAATSGAKTAYQEVYPKFPDPAPNEGTGSCKGLCHSVDNPVKGPKTNLNQLTTYGLRIINQCIALGKCTADLTTKRFMDLGKGDKKTVLDAAGSGVSSQITIDPLEQDCKITTICTYKITLTTNQDSFDGTLSWNTDDAKLIAGIDAPPSKQSGSIKITGHGTTQTFKLNILPQTGIVKGDHHFEVLAFDQSKGGKQIIGGARVSGSINPVPELATGILVTVGMIGLLGLVKTRRK